MRKAQEDYWTAQVAKLKEDSLSKLESRIKAVKGSTLLKNSPSYRNYYEHVKREYAERIGRKICP